MLSYVFGLVTYGSRCASTCLRRLPVSNMLSYYVILYHTMLFSIILCYYLSYYVILYHTVLLSLIGVLICRLLVYMYTYNRVTSICIDLSKVFVFLIEGCTVKPPDRISRHCHPPPPPHRKNIPLWGGLFAHVSPVERHFLHVVAFLLFFSFIMGLFFMEGHFCYFFLLMNKAFFAMRGSFSPCGFFCPYGCLFWLVDRGCT